MGLPATCFGGREGLRGRKRAEHDPGRKRRRPGWNREAADLASRAAEFMLPVDDGEIVRFPRFWTDDMFMFTAMTAAATARGVRMGWIDGTEFMPVIEDGWRAVAARVGRDGTVRDVGSGTGAQPSRAYYLERPVVDGADDRGGAMALLAALEVRELRRLP